MDFIARIRVIQEITFTADVPEPDMVPVDAGSPSLPTETMVNESDVLAARSGAVEVAMDAARQQFGQDAEILIEEVREA